MSALITSSIPVNYESLPSTFPAISVGIEHGKHVGSFDVDIAGITQYLREGGVDDEQIEDLDINFSDEITATKASKSVVVGTYRRKENNISIKHFSDVVVNNHLPMGLLNDYTSSVMSKTLVHELEHMVTMQDESIVKATRKHQIKHLFKDIFQILGTYTAATFATNEIIGNNFDQGEITAPLVGLLGGLAVLKHKELNRYKSSAYLKNPGEIKSYEAEKRPRDNPLVYVTSKEARYEDGPLVDETMIL